MQYLGLILLVFAFVVFCLAAWLDAPDKLKLIAIGLAFATAATIFGGVAHIVGGHY